MITFWRDTQQCNKMSLWSNIWFIEGSLEVKLPTIWTDEKQSRAEAERRERLEERRSEKRKSQKKEDADARKGRKVAKHCVFPMIWGSGGSKSRLAKAAGAEPAGQMRDEKVHAVVARSTFRSQNVQNTSAPEHFWKLRCRKRKKCTPLWREAHLEVKMLKTPGVRTTFGSCDVEKVHAVVARSTFRSQNVQNTSVSDDFWKLRCRKSARRCGAKHISKSKCTKHTMYGPLLEVQMSKKCTLLWCEAHFEVKMLKTPGFGPLLEVQMSLCFASLHSITLHTTTLHYTPQHYNYNYTTTPHYTPLHSTTLHYTIHTTLHYATLHYTTLHSTTLHYTTLRSTTLQLQLHNYTPLHSTTLHYITVHYITLHYTTLPSTTLHYITLHSTTLHYAKLHYTTPHYITLHSTTLHYTTLHSTTLQLQLHSADR